MFHGSLRKWPFSFVETNLPHMKKKRNYEVVLCSQLSISITVLFIAVQGTCVPHHFHMYSLLSPLHPIVPLNWGGGQYHNLHRRITFKDYLKHIFSQTTHEEVKDM